MIFVAKNNIWTPSPRWGQPRFQRGIICATAIYGAGVAGAVTVSGESITDTAINRNARAAVVFRSDGTVDRIINATTTQIDSGTDWIIPNGDANSNYDVRYTGLTGDALDGSTTLAEDVWGDLGTDKFFEQRATVDGENFSSTITIEVRFNGGAALDSASYTLAASRTDI